MDPQRTIHSLDTSRTPLRDDETSGSRRREPDSAAPRPDPPAATPGDRPAPFEPLADASQCEADAGSSSPVAGSEPRGSDRREFPRRPSGSTVAIVENADTLPVRDREWQLYSSQLTGQLIDVSLNGIAFQLGQPLEIQRPVWLRLHSAAFDTSIDIRAFVLKNEALDPGQFKIVCRFEQHLSVEQLAGLGANRFSSHIV